MAGFSHTQQVKFLGVGVVVSLTMALSFAGMSPSSAAPTVAYSASTPNTIQAISPDYVYATEAGTGHLVRAHVSAGAVLGPWQTVSSQTIYSTTVASAARAALWDYSSSRLLLFDNGQPVTSPTPPTGLFLQAMSGSWLRFSDGVTDKITSLDGTSLDISSYTTFGTSGSYGSNTWVTGMLGSLFLVQQMTFSDPNIVTGYVSSVGLTVRDAANGGAVVGKPVVLTPPAKPAWLSGKAAVTGCWLVPGHVNCGWGWGTTSAPVDAGAVTSTDWLTGSTVTTYIPQQFGTPAWVLSVDDGVALVGVRGASGYDVHAIDLTNASQNVQLVGDGSSYILSGNRATVSTFSSSSGTESYQVAELSFGGTSAPYLIGSVGGKAQVSSSAPLKLDLDFTKNVKAGTLTIKDSNGSVMGTVSTPASSDGSLRGISWTPPAGLMSGTYTWTLTATDANGKAAVNNAGSAAPSGKFTLAGTPPCAFTDVPSTNQYVGYVCWMKAMGVTTGTTPTTYAPAANVTRGQMAAFMYRLAGSPTFNPPSKPSFTDVPASNEFFKQIEWLKHTGITTGTTPTTFAPTANVTRGQMAAFMYRLAGSPAFTAPVKATFGDVPASNEFFKQIEWLKNTGITTGTTPTTYAPAANVTREQMAAFMYRLAQGRYYCTSYAGGANC